MQAVHVPVWRFVNEKLLLIAAFVCIAPADSSAATEDAMKTCGAGELRIVDVGSEVLRDPQQRLNARPRLMVAPTLTMPEGQREKGTIITALGPVLGSMDSHDVNLTVECTPTGFALNAQLTRSAEYNGSVLANILWRPKIIVGVTATRPEVTMHVVWTMHTSTGAPLGLARTPPYPELQYPFTLRTLIRGRN